MALFSREIKSKLLQQPVAARCGTCGRKSQNNSQSSKKCINPLQPSGNGKSKILIVMGSPTSMNNASGSWFGDTDVLLREAFNNIDFDLRNDCWLTGAVACYGASNIDVAATSCLYNLHKTVKELNPVVIIPLGIVAVQSVLSGAFSGLEVGDAVRYYGCQIPSKRWNAWICPTYDYDSVVEYGGGDISAMRGSGVVAALWFNKHIENIKRVIDKRPFGTCEIEPQNQVKLLYAKNEISEILQYIGNFDKGYAAFDYETNCLKPEVSNSRVLSASVCLGGYKKVFETVAFPMTPDIIPVWRTFLQSGIPKIAHNLKFEDRWSNVWFGVSVNNWYADTFLNSHILDCRRGVCGLKFQTLVNFGVSGYDDPVKPYISSVDKLNKLHEIPIEQLLLYNGLDSLFTWRLAIKQFKQLGIKAYW
ncbi:MAG: hypothetical protein LBP59_10485 [Planctomycetaceae bacterium]|jgi:uracil-DNA glycosylase|nr:hypothetical protein [Planctomycetaceae bacterium]